MPGKSTTPTTHLFWPAAFHRRSISIAMSPRSPTPGTVTSHRAIGTPPKPFSISMPRSRSSKRAGQKAQSGNSTATRLRILVGDGAVGLWKAIDKAKPGYQVYAILDYRASRGPQNYVPRSAKRMGTNHRQEGRPTSSPIIAPLRAKRRAACPSGTRWRRLLAGEFTNPNLAIDYRRNVVPISQSEYPYQAEKEMYEAFDRGPLPEERLLDREAVELALKSLSGTDRQILKLLLDGFGERDIAAKLGLSQSVRAAAGSMASCGNPDAAPIWPKYVGVKPGRRRAAMRVRVAAVPKARIRTCRRKHRRWD